MFNARAESYDPKAPKAIALTIGLFVLTWLVTEYVIQGSSQYLGLVIVGCAGLAVFMTIMKDWRMGVFIFLSWLVLEDQIRKYMGNSTPIFFAKDVIIGITYLAMYNARRRGKLLTFKPPFMIWLGLFFWMALLQVFNPYSPSLIYGLLGMKTYFYYVPMMYAGYAILRTEEDLHKILILNMWIALIVSGFGLLQSFGGGGFLTPDNIDPELYALSHVTRGEKQLGTYFVRSTSLFVSDGRFGFFLILLFILAFGTAGYLLMRRKRGRMVVFTALGVVTLATIMNGSRGAFVYLMVDTLVLSLAMVWGAPWRYRQAFRMGKTIRNALIISAIAVVLATVFSPDTIRRRWVLYFETLSPTSAHSEFRYRALEYPEKNLESIFEQPNWKWGNGTGVASLGTQYVVRAFGVPRLNVGAESGYALLIAEFGILGPVLWTAWTVSVFFAGWKVVKSLRQTAFFPIGFALFWYVFVLLGYFTFQGLNGYQNYLTNAYLWLIIGILFRLPSLLAETTASGQHARAET
jgi:hypothetical protein